MMEFTDSPLRSLADEIANSGTNSGIYRWEVKFKLNENAPVDLTDETIAVTEDEKNGFFEPVSLLNLDIVRNYLERTGDHYHFNVAMSPGMWTKVILPCRSNCLLHVIRTKLMKEGGADDDSEVIDSWIVKPIFQVPEDQNIEQDVTAMLSRHELDLKAPFSLEFDAIDRNLEIVRGLEVDGNWRKAKAIDVLKGVVAKRAEDVLVEGEPGIIGINCDDKANEDVREHVLIPQGVIKITELTDFLHEKCGGLWGTGASSYLQDRIWTIFSPFDTESYADVEETLTLVVVPGQIYGEVESTFRVEDKRITALVASNFKVRDGKQINYLQEGDGVRFASATRLSTGFTENKGNKAVAKRAANNSESRIKDEGNDQHMTRMAAKRITDNSLAEYSRLAARKGTTLIAEWRKGDHTLIKPGMRTKVLYQDHDNVMELYGRVINMQASIQKLGYGPIVGDHLTTCTLHVFFNAPDSEPL